MSKELVLKGEIRETIPQWLLKYKKRLSFIDVFYKAFTHNCDCEVCRMIRENMKYWEEFLKPKTEG